MRRHIRALGHVAQVAQIALIDDLPIPLLPDAINLAGGAFVNQIKQAGKGVAEAYATAAAMTDIEDALKFLEYALLAIEFGIPPVQGVACRGLQIAFAYCHSGG
jgi:hypothetical protein